MKDETLVEIQDDNLDSALGEFREQIYEYLLSCPMRDIEAVDIVFHRGSSGITPKFKTRRVMKGADVESKMLYNNPQRIIRFSREEIMEFREETNNG